MISVETTTAPSTTFSPRLPGALVSGDRLDPLFGTATDTGTGGAGEPVDGSGLVPGVIRGTVVGIDARHLSTHELRRRLLRERRDFARGVARFPHVRHLIIVLRVERKSESAVSRTLDRAAHSAHVELEMRRGRDVCVTGIVMSGPVPFEVILQRLNQRIRDTPIEGSYVVAACRILTQTVAAAAAEDRL